LVVALGRLKPTAFSIGTFNLATLFAAFKFCHILLASFVFLLLRSFGRAFDDPFVAVSRFFLRRRRIVWRRSGQFFFAAPVLRFYSAVGTV
jgi:hypothetical protein